VRDPYTDHALLSFLVDPESLQDVSQEEYARVTRIAAFFEVTGDELYRKNGAKLQLVPSPANRKLFARVEHE
jgi:hypothetical protein